MRVEAFVPLSASAKMWIEVKEDKWEAMTDEEKRTEFLENCQPTRRICHYCCRDFQTNGEINMEWEAKGEGLEYVTP
jgi:hypothetical protein